MQSPALLLISLFIMYVAEAKHSSAIQKLHICGQNEDDIEECQRRSIKHALHAFKNGNEDLGIVPFDPLVIPSVEIAHGYGADAYRLKLSKCKLRGLSEINIYSVTMSPKEYSFELVGVAPTLTLAGKYESTGILTEMPVEGDGEGVLTMLNTHIILVFRGKIHERGCKTFFKVTHFSFQMHPEEVKFQFDNLFEGDGLMERIALKIMNERQEEIYSQLSPSINEELTRIFRPLFQDFYDKVAYDDLFPEFKRPCP